MNRETFKRPHDDKCPCISVGLESLRLSLKLRRSRASSCWRHLPPSILGLCICVPCLSIASSERPFPSKVASPYLPSPSSQSASQRYVIHGTHPSLSLVLCLCLLMVCSASHLTLKLHGSSDVICLSLFFKGFIYLFLEREGREKERERNVNVWLPLVHPLRHKPGMSPDWELNWRLFGSQAGTQSTEPPQPGHLLVLITCGCWG